MAKPQLFLARISLSLALLSLLSCQQFRTVNNPRDADKQVTKDTGAKNPADSDGPLDGATVAGDLLADSSVLPKEDVNTPISDSGAPPQPPKTPPTASQWLMGAGNVVSSPNYKLRFAFAPTRPVATLTSPNYRLTLGPHGGTK